MKTTFTKTNLMTGDMIVCRNGKAATIMLNTVAGNIARFHTSKDSFSYLDTRYDDDLSHTSHVNMDIVKVYRADTENISEKDVGDLIANPEKMIKYGKLIFDRETADEYEEESTSASKPTLGSLVTGDMLVHKNGKCSTVYKDTPSGDITRYHTENNSFSYLRRFNEDLEHENNDDYNIVAVFRTQSNDSSTVGDAIGNPSKMLIPENLIWSDGTVVANWVYDSTIGNVIISASEEKISEDDETAVSSCEERNLEEKIRDIVDDFIADISAANDFVNEIFDLINSR